MRRVSLAAALFAALAAEPTAPAAGPPAKEVAPFGRENLVAWCIVPFDKTKRGPEDRAAMLERLGFRHFAYDWRPEHVPTFEAEVEALKRHHVALDAWWLAPGVLDDQSRQLLTLFKKHGVRPQLWVLLDLGGVDAPGDEQARRVGRAAGLLRPLAEEAAKVGCTLGLYNHGGWFGEPENQVAIIERLKEQGVTNLGMVYNLHHGHDHLDRFPALLPKIKRYLLCLNLNGMDPGGDKVGRKILPLGQGERDLFLLRTIRDSGYRGPIGILGHTDDDAEARLRDNLDGLDWLVPQLDGGPPPGPKPTPRTPVPPRPPGGPKAADGRAAPHPYDPAHVARLVREAREAGDPRRGADVFASAKAACLTCHKVGGQGGAVGPELSAAGLCLKPEQVVESVLWPHREVKGGYRTLAVVTRDGRLLRGYRLEDTPGALALRDPSTGERVTVPREEVEETKDEGSMMPDAVAAALSPEERRDLFRFLFDIGRPETGAADALAAHAHAPAAYIYDRAPLRPEQRPSWQAPVNRDRVYDFYSREADAFLDRPNVPLLPQYPGLDGGRDGHWGNQNEATWADGRWNGTDLGSVLCGVFRGAGVTVPKGVCVRLGDRGELSACFDPQTLRYAAVWKGGFVTFSPTRHGFMEGLALQGTPLPRPEGEPPRGPFVYHGFYRHGRRVVFSYTVGGVAMLDAPWVDDQGRFTHVVGPARDHPLASLMKGGPAQWPQILTTKGTPGRGDGAYVVDTIAPPFDNPWRALMFFGDHDFLPDGSAFICTMQGDVWHVSGLDDRLDRVRWRRFASGLHHALGLVVAEGKAHVLGKDQITRLHDLDGDGEADFYECVSSAYTTSPAGHDFVCGLQRDAQGRFYTASGPQGLIRISADGRAVETLATGFRNPDGLALAPDGTITVPSSEGDWTPASMICEVGPGSFFGYGGPRKNAPPDLPLVYLPRGLDNSSGGQVFVPDDRFGPLKGQLLHLSFGTGSWFLVLRERVDGQPQGAVVPMPGEFRSGAHRGRFNPKDGQLYVSGMAGWGTYTTDDGSFQRVRYTGAPALIPTAFHAHQNGVLISFSRPLDASLAGRANKQFVQAWNYRYSQGYGSSEWSARHPGATGHDRLAVRSSHVLDDGRTLFVEIPDLQPVNQLHLRLRVGPGDPVDLFATVHRLAPAFTGVPGYAPAPKTIAAHPILADMAMLNARPVPNPFRAKIPGERLVPIAAGKNLSFTERTIRARPGEAIRLTFSNPDVVPHNWALVRPGALARYGALANKIIAEPDAALRQYVPRSDDLIAYTDVVAPQEQFSISFRAPREKGRYPYLCTFPGHWMVMNGDMIVE